MRISEFIQYQQQNRVEQMRHKCPDLPNGSLPPPGHVNPYGEEGMDITGTTSADRKIIPVDEGVANRLRDVVYRTMIESGGMEDVEDVGGIIKSYVMTLDPKDRINAGWTLNEIFHNEAVRLGDYVHSKDPSWNWGKPVDPSILEGYQKGIDIKA